LGESELKRRILTSLIIGSLILPGVFGPKILLLILTLFWIFMALRELLHIFHLKGRDLNPILMVFLTLLLPISFYLHLPIIFIITGVIFVITIYSLSSPTSSISLFSLSLFGIFYLGWLPSHLILLKNLNISVWYIFFPFALTWINDTAAYGIGVWIGKHKLFRKVSPKKSIEGTIGGICFSIGSAIGYARLFSLKGSPWIYLWVGFSLSLIALLGDLLESSLKREVGLKDSSRLLPGHGGFLDRIDSLLFTIPLFYYLLKYLIL